MERRTFFQVMVLAINGLIGIVLGIPAIAYFTDPLRRKSETPRYRVRRLADLKINEPAKVEVRGMLHDAWMKAADVPLGSVWVVRTGEATVNVLQTICPHLGCSIDFESGKFACPCHTSGFALDGKFLFGPALRGMDALEAKVVDGWVEVEFRKFHTGTADKVSIS
jgi:Rieske Fe-S protein